MILRRYRSEDDERITAITRLAWAEVTLWKRIEDLYGPVGGRPWWRHKLDPLLATAKQNPERFIIAESEGLVVGYATYSVNEQTRIGQVLDNAVDPNFGRRGIGSAMHREVLRCLKEAGMKIARVGTFEHQHAARRMYEKHGFKEAGREILYLRSLEEPLEFDSLH